MGNRVNEASQQIAPETKTRISSTTSVILDDILVEIQTEDTHDGTHTYRKYSDILTGRTLARPHLSADMAYEDFEYYNTPQEERPIRSEYENEIEYFEANKEWHEDIGRLSHEFREDLFAYLQIEMNPKREILYSLAYDYGYSGGYSEIFSYAQDLAELIR